MKREEIMQKMSLRFLIVPMALLGLAMAPGIGRADITIVQANNPQPDEANVLIKTENETGTTIQGITNTNPGVLVNFTSLATPQQTLIGTQAGGQAVVQAQDSSGDLIPVQSINFALDGLVRFQDLIFNANVGNNPDATATFIRITAHGFSGTNVAETVTATFDLKNGSNFHTTVAAPPETLSSIDIEFVSALTGGTVDGTGVTDLKPLQAMQLEQFFLTPKNITQGLDVIRGMKSLTEIGIHHYATWPAAEFWTRYDKGEFKK
jgi:hypothetical protein